MVAHHYVLFEGKMPSVDHIIKKMEVISNETIFFNKKKMVLYSNSMSGVVCLDNNDKNYYIVTIFGRRINYLEGVCLCALVELGGKISASLPNWSNKPWNKVKWFFVFKSKKVIYR